MLFGLAGKPMDSNEKAPGFRDFHDRIWAGEISLATDQAKLQYASVHMNQISQNMRAVRFQDALRIVSVRRGPASVPRSITASLVRLTRHPEIMKASMLFVTQRYNRLDARSAIPRNETGCRRHEREQQRNNEKSERVGGANSVDELR